jgi:hypothetical protein
MGQPTTSASNDTDDYKHEEETIEEGGQPPRHTLTTASEQDPDVAPDIQFRAIGEPGSGSEF